MSQLINQELQAQRHQINEIVKDLHDLTIRIDHQDLAALVSDLRNRINDPINGPLQVNRYPSSADLLSYFKAVTPDSLQYLITDLFETVTIYDNKTVDASYTKLSEHKYQVELHVNAKKSRIDSLEVESEIPIDDWIEIGLYSPGEDGENELVYLKKHKISKSDTTLNITVNSPPNLVGIDPLNKLIDKNPEDNLMVVSEGTQNGY